MEDGQDSYRRSITTFSKSVFRSFFIFPCLKESSQRIANHLPAKCCCVVLPSITQPVKMSRIPTVRSIWKVIFAITALLEIYFIALCLRKIEYCQSTTQSSENEFSINNNFSVRAWEPTRTISQLVFVWISPLFCLLCVVEALIQAVEVRKAALDNRALNELEKSLLRAAQRSSVRLSMFFLGSAADQNHKKRTVTTISKVLRSWLSAIATIAFWLLILPTKTADFHRHCGRSRIHDSAVITQWINRSSHSLSNLSLAFHDTIESFFWTRVLPFRIHKEPQRFIHRLQVILRWIRFARFAGPLFRMVSMNNSIHLQSSRAVTHSVAATIPLSYN